MKEELKSIYALSTLPATGPRSDPCKRSSEGVSIPDIPHRGIDSNLHVYETIKAPSDVAAEVTVWIVLCQDASYSYIGPRQLPTEAGATRGLTNTSQKRYNIRIDMLSAGCATIESHGKCRQQAANVTLKQQARPWYAGHNAGRSLTLRAWRRTLLLLLVAQRLFVARLMPKEKQR